jgi:hypothetical protein
MVGDDAKADECMKRAEALGGTADLAANVEKELTGIRQDRPR